MLLLRQILGIYLQRRFCTSADAVYIMDRATQFLQGVRIWLKTPIARLLSYEGNIHAVRQGTRIGNLAGDWC